MTIEPKTDPWDGHPDWTLVPEHLRSGLRAYVEEKREPGDFLMAVLQNDLARAVGRADENSLRGLRDLLSFLWNYAPASCWRSPTNVEIWIREGVDERTGVVHPRAPFLARYVAPALIGDSVGERHRSWIDGRWLEEPWTPGVTEPGTREERG